MGVGGVGGGWVGVGGWGGGGALRFRASAPGSAPEGTPPAHTCCTHLPPAHRTCSAVQADAEATQAEAARRVAERDAEADRAQKEAARARRLEDQLLDAQQRLERLRQQASTPGAADNELQVWHVLVLVLVLMLMLSLMLPLLLEGWGERRARWSPAMLPRLPAPTRRPSARRCAP